MHKIEIIGGKHGAKAQIYVDGVNVTGMTRKANYSVSCEGVPILELELAPQNAHIEGEAVVLIRELKAETKEYDAKNQA